MEYNEHSYRAWIGLYDDTDSWQWSLSNQSFYSPGESDFRKWALEQPDNTGGREHCTLMFDDGGWSDAPCENHYTPVCCDVTGFSVTFVLVPTAMMWSEAQSYCREHHTDLASVRNIEENQRIKDLVPSGQIVWIGLSRDSWLWLDGSDSSFRFWSPGIAEPNNLSADETCAAADFSNNAEWEDWACSWRRAYICFDLGITKHVIKLSVQKTNPSVDLNHPAVMAEILKQLVEKLKDNGVHENIRLSWRKQPDGSIFQKQKNGLEMDVKC
ncbi:secretory phospholipase A2 receptor-like [Cheilinus undulatus]|uniref:secretory phospholipase A2 receptor-like n=1 Tax=Cheilinus undulatus TaxID=241271 RepID=UPI001BD3EAA7|nr:secretory phospholipase A2 receptor-like [Cheilinus undulatus]